MSTVRNTNIDHTLQAIFLNGIIDNIIILNINKKLSYSKKPNEILKK